MPLNGYDSAPPTSKNKEDPSFMRYQSIDQTHMSGSDAEPESNFQSGQEEEEEVEEVELDVLGFRYGIFWLAVVTVIISYLSDVLVASVSEAAKSLEISSIFLAAIIIPIIGNAAEHASAITFGYKNRLELSLAIAVGSSTQIALMVLPLLTIVGGSSTSQCLSISPPMKLPLFS